MSISYRSPDNYLARSHLFRFAASGGEPENVRAGEKAWVIAEVAVRHYPTDTRSEEIRGVSITILVANFRPNWRCPNNYARLSICN